MFPFCPHCGESLDMQQFAGQTVVCPHCRQQVGVVPLPQKPVVVDQTEELIRSGTVARCPQCAQVIEIKARGASRTFVPHFAPAPQRKLCPNSGKALATEPPAAPTVAKKGPAGKDLSAYMTRDVIRVVLCQQSAAPQIEELTLEYLDKADRVRIQIETLREILGPNFRMQAYPPSLQRADLAFWGNASACVIARQHPQGGYQTLSDAEIGQIVADVKQHRALFLA